MAKSQGLVKQIQNKILAFDTPSLGWSKGNMMVGLHKKKLFNVKKLPQGLSKTFFEREKDYQKTTQICTIFTELINKDYQISKN